MIEDQQSLVGFIQRLGTFSLKTFGPGERPSGIIDHIRKELVEIEEDPTDAFEWADVVILALDGALRAGNTPGRVADVLEEKMSINERRQWPDWRDADPNTAIEHVRDQEG